MADSLLPEVVRALLRDHLTSFESLEILLLLREYSPQYRSAHDISRETGVPADLTLSSLTALESSRLIERTANGSLQFRFAPASAGLSEAVAELASMYRDQRAAVMSEMSLNAISRIRSGTLRAFADSFILNRKKDESDG